MFELIKLLTEEENKLDKILLKLTQYTFTIFVSANFFELFVSDFSLINPLNPSEWLIYFTSGYALIAIFIFFICNISLFHVLPIITTSILKLLNPKITDADIDQIVDFSVNNTLIKVLKWLKIITYNNQFSRFQAGENTDKVFDLFTSKLKEDEEHPVQQMEDNLAYLWNLYIILVVSYIIYIHLITKSLLLPILIVSVGIILLIVNLGISVISTLYKKYREDLEFILKYLIADKSIEDALQRNGISLEAVIIKSEPQTILPGFTYREKKYLIFHLMENKPLRRHIAESLIVGANELNRKIILINTRGTTKAAKLEVEKNKNSIMQIEYDDIGELSLKLTDEFSDAFD